MSLMSGGTRSQTVYTTLLGTIVICTGISMSWSSAAIPHLMSGDVGFVITSNEASWAVSLLNVGCIMSSLITAYIIDYWGRRGTILLAGLLYMVSWTFLIYGNHVWFIYAGRIFAGLGFGTTIVCCILYIGEIADKNYRGALTMVLMFMSNLGYVTGYIAGACTSYLTCNYIYAAITLTFFSFFYVFMPESPYFHIKNKNTYAAEKVLLKLRDYKSERCIAEEVNEIERIVQADMKNKTSFKELFTNKLYRKGLSINTALNITVIASGNYIITSYMQTIIEKVGLNISPKVTPIVYGCLQMIIGILPAFILDKFGRKNLMLLSLSGVAIAQLSLGAFFYIQSRVEDGNEIMSSMNWLPFAAFSLFCICYNAGVAPVVLVLEGELYPMNVKSVGMSVGTVFTHVISIAFVKLYQILADGWGLYLPFWSFSVIISCAIVFFALSLPETKGKPFDSIQKELNKGSFFRCKYS